MKESKENKDNLSKIRKCIVKGKHLTDIWNEPIVGKATIEKPVRQMGVIAPIPKMLSQEHHVTGSTEIQQTEESEVTGTTAEIPDSGIDHKV